MPLSRVSEHGNGVGCQCRVALQVAPGTVDSENLQRNGIVTAVATNKQLLLGQQVRLEGRWAKHQKYGMQLQARPFAAL